MVSVRSTSVSVVLKSIVNLVLINPVNFLDLETPDVEEGAVHVICESFEEKRNRYEKLEALQRWYLIGASVVIVILLITSVIVTTIWLY